MTWRTLKLGGGCLLWFCFSTKTDGESSGGRESKHYEQLKYCIWIMLTKKKRKPSATLWNQIPLGITYGVMIKGGELISGINNNYLYMFMCCWDCEENPDRDERHPHFELATNCNTR